MGCRAYDFADDDYIVAATSDSILPRAKVRPGRSVGGAGFAAREGVLLASMACTELSCYAKCRDVFFDAIVNGLNATQTGAAGHNLFIEYLSSLFNSPIMTNQITK